MSDKSKESEAHAAESAQPDEDEPIQYREVPKREVPEEELKEILAEHERWLKSKGKDGKRADLSSADLFRAKLQGAVLREANLQQAYLRRADLQRANLADANLEKAFLFQANLAHANLMEANLKGANLREANLQMADFVGAHLEEADFGGANLQKSDLRFAGLQSADFSGADLRHARMAGVTGLETAVLTDINLEGATGLLGTTFAGMDITGAKLPTDIAKFEGLDHVTEISKHARTIFLAMIGGCVFSWLTIATTMDVALLTNTASTPLPIIQTKVPIAGFYWAAPVILLALYFYLHMYLQRLWEGLAGLPAIFPDGRTLDERAYPWLLSGLVRAHVPLLKANRPSFSYLQVFLSIVAAWALVPTTIGLFWLRYLVLHEWWIGTVLHISLVTLAVALGASFYWHARVTLRGDKRPDFGWKTPWKALTESKMTRAYAALILCVAAATGAVSDGAINGVPAWSDDHESAWGHRKLVPAALEFVGYRTALKIGQEEISIKPTNWTGLEKGDELKAQFARVKGAQLARRDLRYAAARDAFLVKADLSKANLQNADLRRANLQEANLQFANLQGANLVRAKLQKANLKGANLQGANLSYAKLQGAVLRNANLQGAVLERAKLQGANLVRAKLQKANLKGANLQGANLQGANLRYAKLQGAVLRNANLQGANLKFAKLQGTRLLRAKIQGADFSLAKGLTQEQLDKACGNAKTQLPLGMSIKPCPKEPK